MRPPDSDELTQSWAAYYYARNTLKGRFPAGEAAIAQSSGYAYNYANDVLNGRFPEGERAIAADWWYSQQYLKRVLKVLPEKAFSSLEHFDTGWERVIDAWRMKVNPNITITRYG